MQISIGISVKGSRTSSSGPVNTVAPVISGTTTLGSVLTSTTGTWTYTILFSYQWNRNFSPIPSATTSTYTLVQADSASAITCVVTATDASGSTPATSNIITAGTYAAPVNSSPPSISGTTTIDSVLTSTLGGWLNSPTSYAFQWNRNGSPIPSATTSTYTLVQADSASVITCVVTATNALGSTPSTSNTLTIPTYSTAFTSTWAVTAGETITLPYEAAGTYSGTIDWGDSTTSVNSYDNRTHTYVGAGTYTISITGVTTGFRFNNTGSKLNIRTITNWGTLKLGNNNAYFQGCTNLTLSTVVGTLDFSGTTDLSNMFNSCSSLTTVNGINSWSTGSVTNMSNMFNGCTSFSQGLLFNTAAVTNMSGMFNSATAFNNSLTFNTAAVTTMQGMFFGCTNFNKPLTFNTALVTNMSFMFAAANAFNQPLSFNTAEVTDMSFMFFATTAFNQDISYWNTAKVTNMTQMFFGSAFNQNIGSWNVANVTDFAGFMASKTNLTFSPANLDAIYSGWSTSGVKPNINISFGSARFTNAGGLVGKNILLGAPNNWTIADGGGV
jgi:surface protein